MIIGNEMDKKIIEELLNQTDTLIKETTSEIDKLNFELNQKMILKDFLDNKRYSFISMETFKLNYDESIFNTYRKTCEEKERKIVELNKLKNDFQNSLDIYKRTNE